ncbi:hypothetical protein IWQ60_004285 [Tieghemiomyces parasiticus]|uniref:MHD domain-containing protein n=1 Tax=Tieghemiomyces parasiticus TaxID=78921 RepID=A0A9W8A8I5_9FUNG|nr:hypothetical protein IWQ60_004285 [Tieghemiomyces parasiticus]
MDRLLGFTVDGELLLRRGDASIDDCKLLLAKLHQFQKPTAVFSGIIAIRGRQYAYLFVDDWLYLAASLTPDPVTAHTPVSTRTGTVGAGRGPSPLLNPVMLSTSLRTGRPKDDSADQRPRSWSMQDRDLTASVALSRSAVAAMATLTRLVGRMKRHIIPLTVETLPRHAAVVGTWFTEIVREWVIPSSHTSPAGSVPGLAGSMQASVVQTTTAEIQEGGTVNVDLVEAVSVQYDPYGAPRRAVVEGALTVTSDMSCLLPIEMGLRPFYVHQNAYPVPLSRIAYHPLVARRDHHGQPVLVFTPTQSKQAIEVMRYQMITDVPTLFRIFCFLGEMTEVEPRPLMQSSASSLPSTSSDDHTKRPAALRRPSAGPSPPAPVHYVLDFSIQLRSDFSQSKVARDVVLTLPLPVDTLGVEFSPVTMGQPTFQLLPPVVVYRIVSFPGGNDSCLEFKAYSESPTLHPSELGPIE